MNSMPQHESPRGRGHTLFLRHQLTIEFSVDRRNPPSVDPVAETRSVFDWSAMGFSPGCTSEPTARVPPGARIRREIRAPGAREAGRRAPPAPQSLVAVLRPVHGALLHHVPPAEEEDAG